MSTKAKFEYEHRDTWIHRMHPIPKLSLFSAIGAFASIWMDFRYSLVLSAVALVMWQMGKVPKAWKPFPFLFAMGTEWSAILLIVPFLGTSYKVLPLGYATTVLLDLGTIPILNLRAVYTYGSAWWIIRDFVRYWCVVSAALTMYYTTSIPNVAQVFLGFKIPPMITFALIATYRFFPVFIRLASDVVNSLRLRGWESSRNPITLTKRIIPMMTPVCRQFIVAVDMVNLSCVNRAFGAYPKRPHKRLPMTAMHWVITIVPWILWVIAFYLVITPPYWGNL